jgi:hypothetical protein
MPGRVRLAGLAAALLLIFLPSFALAYDINFGVVPAEVRIRDLRPGETTGFELTIHNNDAVPRVFTLACFPPPDGEETEGTTRFPNVSWIDFSPNEIAVAPYGEAIVTVTLAIPRDQDWTSQDWETWLGVAAQSSDLLGVKLCVRLLVSTGSTISTRFNIRLFAGLGLAAALLGSGGYYYFRRRARYE